MIKWVKYLQFITNSWLSNNNHLLEIGKKRANNRLMCKEFEKKIWTKNTEAHKQIHSL